MLNLGEFPHPVQPALDPKSYDNYLSSTRPPFSQTINNDSRQWKYVHTQRGKRKKWDSATQGLFTKSNLKEPTSQPDYEAAGRAVGQASRRTRKKEKLHPGRIKSESQPTCLDRQALKKKNILSFSLSLTSHPSFAKQLRPFAVTLQVH